MKLRIADLKLIETRALESGIVRRDEQYKPIPAVDRYCAEIVEVYCAYLRGNKSFASSDPFQQPITGGTKHGRS